MSFALLHQLASAAFPSSLVRTHTHMHHHMLYLQESPFLPKAATASPAKEPSAHVQISRSLFCFIPAAGGAAFCLIYSVLLTRCSEDRIIYVLLSFSRLLSAVASTRANSCLHSVHLRAVRRHQRPILQTRSGEALSSSQDFWLPSWRWQSPDFPKHFMFHSSFHVQITAPLCTHSYKPDALLCFARAIHRAP